MSEVRQFGSSAAPADARPHAKWPRWKIIVAYAVLIAIACVSIWFVDRSAMKVQNESVVGPTETGR